MTNEQMKKTIYTRCKMCGHLNPASAQTCQSCGFDIVLYGETVVEGGPEPAPKPTSKPKQAPKPKPAPSPKPPKPEPVAPAATDKRTMYILIGIFIACCFLLGHLELSHDFITGGVYFMVCVLVFLAEVYGPVIGAAAGFVGFLLYYLGIAPNLIATSGISFAVLGLTAGFFAKKLRLKDADTLFNGLIRFNTAQLLGGSISFGIVNSALSGYSLSGIISEFWLGTLVFTIPVAIGGSLMYVIYTVIQKRKQA